MTNWYKYFTDLAWYDWGDAHYQLTRADIDLNAAWSNWNEPNDHTAIQYTMMAMRHIIDAGYYLLSEGSPIAFYPTAIYALRMAWQYTIEDFPTVDYKAICEAWGEDDFKGASVTIAFIDRMRQLIWDEPFYALWAARPEETEIE